MSRIVISLASRGREHASRALAIVELLAGHHDILLVAPQSVDVQFIASCAKYSSVELFTVPAHAAFSRLQHRKPVTRESGPSGSIVSFFEALRLVENRVQRFSPDLLIAGFEPLLPRVGRRLRIRTIGVDYQHVIDDLDLRAVPFAARLRLAAARFASRIICPTVDQNIITSFHAYPVRHRPAGSPSRYRRISVLLRRELQVGATRQSHLLVKMNSSFDPKWLDQLLESKLPARIYGVKQSESRYNLTFRDSKESFADDLLSCAGVITDSGNQLIGEALACGKAVLAIPSQTQYHKRISALFLSKGEIAGASSVSSLNSHTIREFYDTSAQCTSTQIPASNYELLSMIDSQLML